MSFPKCCERGAKPVTITFPKRKTPRKKSKKLSRFPNPEEKFCGLKVTSNSKLVDIKTLTYYDSLKVDKVLESWRKELTERRNKIMGNRRTYFDNSMVVFIDELLEAIKKR